MAKREIQSTIFAIRQSITPRDNDHVLYNLYTYIKVEYQQNSDIITDVTD